MEGARDLPRQQQLQVLYLILWDSECLSLKIHETDNTRCTEYPEASSLRVVGMHKCIAGEQRHANLFVPVAPGVNFGAQGQEGLNALVL